MSLTETRKVRVYSIQFHFIPKYCSSQTSVKLFKSFRVESVKDVRTFPQHYNNIDHKMLPFRNLFGSFGIYVVILSWDRWRHLQLIDPHRASPHKFYFYIIQFEFFPE